jgi:hypothetical protein
MGEIGKIINSIFKFIIKLIYNEPIPSIGIVVTLVLFWINRHSHKAGFSVKLIPKSREFYKKGNKPTVPFIEIIFRNRSSNNIFFKLVGIVHNAQPSQIELYQRVEVPKFYKANGFIIFPNDQMEKFDENMNSITFRSNFNREVKIKGKKLKKLIKIIQKTHAEYKENLEEYNNLKKNTDESNYPADKSNGDRKKHSK